MWKQEAQSFLQSFIDNGTILQGNLIGINDGTAIAIVIMLDTLVTPNKAVEKYYFLKKRESSIDFYEMDRLPKI